MAAKKAPAKGKMTMKKWEGSAADEAMDKKMGYPEGSPKDMALDKKMVKKASAKKAPPKKMAPKKR